MKRRAAIAALLIVVAAAAILLAMGRNPICTCGAVDLWVGARDSPQTSQMLADWYSLSHIVHGLLFYAALWLVARRWPVERRFLAALLVEAAWEVIENTPMVIDRYRETTAALGYTGDSVINSLSDIVMMALRLPARAQAAAVGLGRLAGRARIVPLVRDPRQSDAQHLEPAGAQCRGRGVAGGRLSGTNAAFEALCAAIDGRASVKPVALAAPPACIAVRPRPGRRAVRRPLRPRRQDCRSTKAASRAASTCSSAIAAGGSARPRCSPMCSARSTAPATPIMPRSACRRSSATGSTSAPASASPSTPARPANYYPHRQDRVRQPRPVRAGARRRHPGQRPPEHRGELGAHEPRAAVQPRKSRASTISACG